MPKSVCKELTSTHNFLWGWRSHNRKIVWTKWENLGKPNEEGGLRIIDIVNFNIALLVKWKWRLGMENQGVWKEVVYNLQLQR